MYLLKSPSLILPYFLNPRMQPVGRILNYGKGAFGTLFFLHSLTLSVDLNFSFTLFRYTWRRMIKTWMLSLLISIPLTLISRKVSRKVNWKGVYLLINENLWLMALAWWLMSVWWLAWRFTWSYTITFSYYVQYLFWPKNPFVLNY